MLIQAEAGLLSVTGTPETPSKAGNSMADIAAGMYAYSSILAALLQRARTGEGSHIDVSMLESLSIYPYGPFATADGAVILGIQNEREWAVFCEKVLGDARFAVDPRFDSNAQRNENRLALQALILKVFAALSTAQVEQRLDDAQIANARMNDMAGLWAHPQLQARGRWRKVGSPAGEIPALLPPGRNNSFDYRMDAVPAVGEHTAAILRELGIEPQDQP